MADKTLFNLNWEKYLMLLFLLFGVGFFSSGVVTWVAANWDYFSKFQKLYAVQFWLSVSIFAALFFYFRESKKLAAGKIKVVTAVFFFISAVFIGALFALIGQIYQTGANAWQLFALWSVLQIPFFLILPNIGSALLLGATLNTTHLLYFPFIDDYIFATSVILNFAFVILAELYIKKSREEIWRIIVKVATIAVSFGLSGMALMSDAQAFWACVISGVLLFRYKMRDDMFLIIVYFVALVVNVDIFLIRIADGNESSLFIAAMLTLGAVVFGATQIKRRFFVHNPKLELTWAVQLMFSLLALLVSILFVGWLMTFGVQDKSVLFIAALFLFIGALWLHYRKKQDYLVDIFMTMSGIMLLFALYVIGDKSDFEIILLSVSLYVLAVYYLRLTLWLRCLAVILFISVVLENFYVASYLIYSTEITFFQQLLGYASHQWLMLGAVILFYLKGINRNETVAGYITPVAWAFLLLSCWMCFLAYLDVHIRDVFDSSNDMVKINSLSDFFHVSTGGVFSELKTGFEIYYTLYFTVCLSALAVFLLLSKRYGLNTKHLVSAVTALILFSTAFVSINMIAFALALLLLAYVNAGRILFALAVLLLLTALSWYYYILSVPLLYKSFLLLFFGVIFVALSALLYGKNTIHEKSEPPDFSQEREGSHQVPKLKPVLALSAWLGILIFANYNIVKFEGVLNQGKPIILKLAPVDPRSLMQGDFMALNYEILTSVRETLTSEDAYNENKQEKEKAYLLVKYDKHNVAVFCRLEENVPQQFNGCEPNIYLPLNLSSYWSPQLPTHSYFFSEGKGAYYAKAQYGEYRFKDGTALLFRLLDENLNPL